MPYTIPETVKIPKVGKHDVLLVANGDLRLSANQRCWAAQHEMESSLTAAVADCGHRLVRAHAYKADEQHGFIGSQKEGMQVFAKIDPGAPLIVAEAVWQYSHHLLHGLITHEGPILTVANWSGTWPGLVGMLNLNGSLTKAGVKYSTLWAEDFQEEGFRHHLKQWLTKGRVRHRTEHVTPWSHVKVPSDVRRLGQALARQLQRQKAIMGVFDEGCMGMFNAIIPDHLLNPTGVYKERLSQSALYYESTQVSDATADEVLRLDGIAGDEVPHGAGPRTGSDGRADPHAVQDVCRGRTTGRRFWLRHDRHSVPAGIERPDASQRPGGRHAEQRRPSSGTRSTGTARCCATASRSRTSTKWTNARGWTD